MLTIQQTNQGELMLPGLGAMMQVAAASAQTIAVVAGNSSTGTTRSVAIPAGVQAHDTIVIVMAVPTQPMAPSGFTAAVAVGAFAIFYKLDASGSEGTSVSISGFGSSDLVCFTSYILRGLDTGASPVATTGTGGSDYIDPPNRSSLTAANTYAVLAAGESASLSANLPSVVSFPSSYSDGQSVSAAGSVSSWRLQVSAWRIGLTGVTSENPGRFNLDGPLQVPRSATVTFKMA